MNHLQGGINTLFEFKYQNLFAHVYGWSVWFVSALVLVDVPKRAHGHSSKKSRQV